MGLRLELIATYLSLYLSIFLPFMAKFVSQFSQELCKLESSSILYFCRMSDCIVGLRLKMALILLFLSIFLSFPTLHITLKSLSEFSHNVLKLKS